LLADTHAEEEHKERNAKKREIEGMMTGDTIRVPVLLIMQGREI
jgi:ribosomal protein L19